MPARPGVGPSERRSLALRAGPTAFPELNGGLDELVTHAQAVLDTDLPKPGSVDETLSFAEYAKHAASSLPS